MHLTASGATGLAGAWTGSLIRCAQPSVSGLVIAVFAAPPDKTVTTTVTLSPGSVIVNVRSGAGTSYVQRDFSGSGVTAFDPAMGASIDSDLVPTPSAQKPGSLGAITHLAGTIDCASQSRGISTIVVVGSSVEGATNGPLDPFRVECDTTTKYGLIVGIMGIIMTGTTPTWMSVNVSTDHATILFIPRSGPQHSYASSPTGKVSTTADGAHLDADFLEALTGGPRGMHTVHLSGDATCGSTFAF